MRLADASEENYWNDVFDLYGQAFPAEELMTIEDLTAMVDQGRCHIQALVDDDQFVGLSITFSLERYTYLAYFAIRSDLRGQGYGSKALTLIKDTYRNLVLEIETTYQPESLNFKQRLKRKQFYLKQKLKASHFTVSCYGVTMELMSTMENYHFKDYVKLYERLFGKKETANNIALDTILLQ